MLESLSSEARELGDTARANRLATSLALCAKPAKLDCEPDLFISDLSGAAEPQADVDLVIPRPRVEAELVIPGPRLEGDLRIPVPTPEAELGSLDPEPEVPPVTWTRNSVGGVCRVDRESRPSTTPEWAESLVALEGGSGAVSDKPAAA